MAKPVKFKWSSLKGVKKRDTSTDFNFGAAARPVRKKSKSGKGGGS